MVRISSMIRQKTFNDTTNAHKDGRLIQAWLILIGKAHNRQTVTYAELTQLMRGKGAPSLGRRVGQWKGLKLGHLWTYCKNRKFPLLPVIVVTKKTGKPADLAPYNPPDLDKERERVFEFNWYAYFPPSESDLVS